MRHFALGIAPFLAFFAACMQMPGSGSEDSPDAGCEFRIGGNSVGCGNPSKGVAQSEIKAAECLKADCLAGYAPLRYRLSLGEALSFEWKSFPLPDGHTLPDSFESKRIEIRYGNQLHLVDSLPLKVLYSDDTAMTRITFSQACEAVDHPDSACSGKKWDRIPISISISIAFYAVNDRWTQIIELGGLYLNTQSQRIESASLDTTVMHFAKVLSGYYNQEILWKAPLSPNHFRIVYIPGTTHYSVLCEDNAPLDIGKIPLGAHRLNVVTVSQKDAPHWFPVRYLDSVRVVYGLGDDPPDEHLIEGNIIDSVKLPPGFGFGQGYTACP